MVKTRSQRLADEAVSEPSDNDDRQSSEEEDPQSSEEEDLQDDEQFDPSKTNLVYRDHLSEEKEDPNSTYYSHAVRVKKPVDPPSRRLSPTPSTESEQPPQSRVQEVVEIARKRPGEFVELPKADNEEKEEEKQSQWRIRVVAVGEAANNTPKLSERQTVTSVDPPAKQASDILPDTNNTNANS